MKNEFLTSLLNGYKRGNNFLERIISLIPNMETTKTKSLQRVAKYYRLKTTQLNRYEINREAKQ